MNSEQDPRELQIIRSWYSNAQAWSNAIATAAIASRKLVTNQAIIDAVCSISPRRVLDIGCGEGWLARALSARGVGVLGVDAVPDLIARAQALGGGEFRVCDYESIAKRQWQADAVDAIVCNFSLLGRDSVESLIAALPGYLGEPGHLIIQTLHPRAACGDKPYQDGWREGSWAGFSSDFGDPAPWYFRTIESWSALLQRCDFDIIECREPCAAHAVTPASIIWICKAGRSAQTSGARRWE
jgi:2-polyprenyl-3-methyl-5-hydroxy-6-metoxy-1,4-benzoquinol methylase